MGVILTDLGNEKHELDCNWWNWRPTLELISQLGLIDEERLGLLGMNVGAEVSAEEAAQIADYLEKQVLPPLPKDARIGLDGSVTAEPDDGTFYRDPAEQHKNYSASAEWLQEFARFCRTCRGFEVY